MVTISYSMLSPPASLELRWLLLVTACSVHLLAWSCVGYYQLQHAQSTCQLGAEMVTISYSMLSPPASLELRWLLLVTTCSVHLLAWSCGGYYQLQHAQSTCQLGAVLVTISYSMLSPPASLELRWLLLVTACSVHLLAWSCGGYYQLQHAQSTCQLGAEMVTISYSMLSPPASLELWWLLLVTACSVHLLAWSCGGYYQLQHAQSTC